MTCNHFYIDILISDYTQEIESCGYGNIFTAGLTKKLFCYAEISYLTDKSLFLDSLWQSVPASTTKLALLV